MKHFLFIFSFFYCLNLESQNLMINGDFEILDSCPDICCSVFGLNTWRYCNDSPFGIEVCTACNNYSFADQIQTPKSGQTFIGIATEGISYNWWEPQQTWHWENAGEYLEGKISQTLKKDSLYKVSYSVNLSDLSYFTDPYFGFAFYENQNSFPWDEKPVNPDAFRLNYELNDTANWVDVVEYYYGKGFENYIMFGRYLYDPSEADDEFKSIVPNTLIWDTLTYYHLDDVKIIPTHFVVPNVITVNNDQINDGFSLGFLHKENLEFIVLNRWGNVIFESKDEMYFPNENVMNQISGDVTLFYILKSDKKIIKQDFIYVIKK